MFGTATYVAPYTLWEIVDDIMDHIQYMWWAGVLATWIYLSIMVCVLSREVA